jgi:S-phase kinase-associated protein 1
MSNSDKKVKLQPSDDPTTIVEISIEAVNLSHTIKNMIDDLGSEGLNVAIPLHNVTLKILTKVVEFCNHYIEKSSSIHSNDIKSTILLDDNKEKINSSKNNDDNTFELSPWEVNYCEVDQATLFELILAANYLDIKPLLNITCQSVANMIKGKTPEEIRKTFNIKNDFTPEEEEKVRKENEWCEER